MEKTVVVILAAGRGTRLGALTETRPKALLPMGQTTLLRHQIDCIAATGFPLDHVLVMTGHGASQVEEAIREFPVASSLVDGYAGANNIVTLREGCSRAADRYSGASRIVIVNSDVLAAPALFERILSAPSDCAAMVDAGKPLGAEEMKVRVDQGRILCFSKDLDPGDANGEYIGLSVFAGPGLARLAAALDELVSAGRIDLWYEDAFNRVANEAPIVALDTGGLPWIEIDDQRDYERAQRMFEELRVS